MKSGRSVRNGSFANAYTGPCVFQNMAGRFKITLDKENRQGSADLQLYVDVDCARTWNVLQRACSSAMSCACGVDLPHAFRR